MLKIVNLSKSFNKNTDNEINIFRNFNLRIEKNKCTAIIGPNGCGKSTLLNIIGGSIPSDKGEIILNNQDITQLKEEKELLILVGYIKIPPWVFLPPLLF